MYTGSPLHLHGYFTTPIYTVEKPEFIEKVNQAATSELAKITEIDPTYPVKQTSNLFEHPDIDDFLRFIGETSWNILNEQGYNMDMFSMNFLECWVQEHYTHSMMEQHTHVFPSHMIGFYFLEVPENAPKAKFYDPRPAKTQIDLPQRSFELTMCSSVVAFDPKPGLFIFTNSWLAHSFAKNASNKAFRFVHFNMTAESLKNTPVVV